ncbi:MAG: hypothetical protein ACXVYV_03190 [Gaiellales bacterium]
MGFFAPILVALAGLTAPAPVANHGAPERIDGQWLQCRCEGSRALGPFTMIARGYVDWSSWIGAPVVITDRGTIIGRSVAGRARLAPGEHELAVSTIGAYIITINGGDTVGGPPP